MDWFFDKQILDWYQNILTKVCLHRLGTMTCLDTFSRCINPFPNKPWFSHVYSINLLKNTMEKNNLLVLTNSSFFYSVFYCFRELPAIFIKFQIVVCKPFHFKKTLNFLFGKVPSSHSLALMYMYLFCVLVYTGEKVCLHNNLAIILCCKIPPHQLWICVFHLQYKNVNRNCRVPSSQCPTLLQVLRAPHLHISTP